MNKQRRHFVDHGKVAILKRHLVEKIPVSGRCDQLGTDPNQFYDWLKKSFENCRLDFANGRKSKAVEDAQHAKVQQLEAKLVRKNGVLAELLLGFVPGSDYDAALDLCQRLNVPLPLLPSSAAATREEEPVAKG